EGDWLVFSFHRGQHGGGDGSEKLIAGDDVALLVDHEKAISVAVESGAEERAALAHGRTERVHCAGQSGIGRAAGEAAVDRRSNRLDLHTWHLLTQGREEDTADAVARVNDDGAGELRPVRRPVARVLDEVVDKR